MQHDALAPRKHIQLTRMHEDSPNFLGALGVTATLPAQHCWYFHQQLGLEATVTASETAEVCENKDALSLSEQQADPSILASQSIVSPEENSAGLTLQD